MPIYEYHCKACDREFELLVLSRDETVACPECGATNLQRLLSIPAGPQRLPSALRHGRALAAREGHFSHYSKAERKKHGL